MGERLSRFGVGPKIVSVIGMYAAAAGGVSYRFPRACLIPALGHPAVAAFAWVLVAIGLAIWFLGAVSVMQAYNRDELVTSGVFAIVRHPMYAGWIVLVLPGLTLLSTSWLLMLTPAVAYAAFKRLIHWEDEYLSKRFGRSYLNYCGHVNEVIPIPRFGHRLGRVE